MSCIWAFGSLFRLRSFILMVSLITVLCHKIVYIIRPGLSRTPFVWFMFLFLFRGCPIQVLFVLFLFCCISQNSVFILRQTVSLMFLCLGWEDEGRQISGSQNSFWHNNSFVSFNLQSPFISLIVWFLFRLGRHVLREVLILLLCQRLLLGVLLVPAGFQVLDLSLLNVEKIWFVSYLVPQGRSYADRGLQRLLADPVSFLGQTGYFFLCSSGWLSAISCSYLVFLCSNYYLFVIWLIIKFFNCVVKNMVVC